MTGKFWTFLVALALAAASALGQVERLGFVATLSTAEPAPGSPVASSADGRFFAAIMPWGVTAWDLGRAVRLEGIPKLAETITALAFTPEDQLACAGSSGVWIIDLQAKAVRRLAGSWGNVSAMAFSRNLGAWANEQANSVQIRSLDNGLLERSFHVQTSEIRGLAFSPDGLRVAAGEAFGIARLWSVRTNCIQQTFPNRSSNLGSLNFSADGRWLLATSTAGIQVSDVISGEEVKRFLPDSGGFLSSAFTSDGSVIAVSSDNGLQMWRSSRLSRLSANARKPVLHVVVVGINSYQNPKWQLGFAQQDANDLDAFIEQQESRLFWQPRSVRALGACATSEEIRSVLDQLAVEAQPEDAVLFFFAGHGMQSGEEFYLFPYDMHAVEPEQMQHWGLSGKEIGSALQKIPARRQIMIIDACQSGAAVSAIRSAFQRGQTAAGRSLQILAASADTEEAMEAEEEGHGILTSVLLARLRKAVESHQSVAVSEWLESAVRGVPALAAKYNKSGPQKPELVSMGADIPFLIRSDGSSAGAEVAEAYSAMHKQAMPDAFSCRPTASDQTFIRAQGVAEPLGDVIFRCSGSRAATIKLQLFVNSNLTQRVSEDNRSDMIAIVEKPGTRTELKAIRVGANAFPGQMNAANAVVWSSLPLAANALAGRMDVQVRITNLRFNGGKLALGGGLVSTPGLAHYTVENETGIVLQYQQIIAYITGALVQTFGGCTGSSGPVSFNSASDENAGLLSGDSRQGVMQLGVRVQELVPDHFLPAGTRATQRQVPPGFPPFAESPEQGTRFILRLGALPVGMAVYASTTALRASSTPQARAQLIETDANGYGPFKRARQSVVGECGQSTVSMVRLPVQGSTASAVWEVTGSDPFDLDTFQFGLMIAYRSDPAKNLPSMGQVTASINYAPVSSIVPATASSVPVLQFMPLSAQSDFFHIDPPSILVVFPSLSNRQGMESGVSIVNTGQGPGFCTLTYRGSATDGGHAPAAQNTQALAAGQRLAFTLSGGGSHGVLATPGFEGCIIAVCHTTSVEGLYSTFRLGTQPVKLEKARVLESVGNVEAMSTEVCSAKR